MRHRHLSLDEPPHFCEECGKRWASVVDGRAGRRRRRERKPRSLMSLADAMRFGFEWPSSPTPKLARLQIWRLAALPGERRVVGVNTERDEVHVTVSRTGLIRVFRDSKELKEVK